MSIIARTSLGQPSHEVEIILSIEGEGIAVEEVDDQGVVAVGGVLIGHQFAVLPDGDYVGQIEDGDVFVDCVAFWLGDVGFDGADFEGRACWFATERVLVGGIAGGTGGGATRA